MERWLLALGCLLLFAAPLHAEVTRGEMLAIQCFACHGVEGRSPGRIPKLDEPEELREEMVEFKSGEHKSTIMERIARGYSEEEIGLIADYFGGKR